MSTRVGLGPVFTYEWLAASRRWQGYALRALFVSFLLASLWLTWLSNDSDWGVMTVQAQAELGESFYTAIVSTQFVLLLLAAPAATAGAICLDKARGSLTHLLATDLSNTEIILGKLAARLTPILGLTASALPALALGTLLGGVDPNALTGAFLLSVGVSILGCSLALFFSVWGTKLHDVLMATYAVLIVWVLAGPLLWFFSMLGVWPWRVPTWLNLTNPFWLAFAVSWRSGQVDLTQDLRFLGACLGVSAVLISLAVLRLRAAALNQSGRPTAPWRWNVRFGAPKLPLPGWLRPELDPNPVLWREWQRRRPTRWGRILWGTYAAGAIVISAGAIVKLHGGDQTGGEISLLFIGLQIAWGFLLLSVSSADSLGEERVRGSLDVLLTTPMSTLSIVLGKWWGGFRGAMLLAILPGLVTLTVAITRDSWLAFPLIVGLILAFGAALTSLGLALATWIPRQTRATGLTVTAYLLVTVGWPILSAMFIRSSSTPDSAVFVMASPPFATFISLEELRYGNFNTPHRWTEVAIWLSYWIVVDALIAIGLFTATLATFDRCLGRAPERGRAARRLQPKPARRPSAPVETVGLTD